MMQNQILHKGKLYLISSIAASILLSGCFGGEEKKQANADAVIKTPIEQPKVEEPKAQEPTNVAVTETTKEDVAQKTEDVKEEIKEVAATVEKEVQSTPITTPSLDGAKLYAKCASCHGANGEKVALNVSKIIKDLTKENFISSVKGYQDGTYGGKMKTLMAGQVKSLTDDEIKAIADFIVK